MHLFTEGLASNATYANKVVWHAMMRKKLTEKKQKLLDN